MLSRGRFTNALTSAPATAYDGTQGRFRREDLTLGLSGWNRRTSLWLLAGVTAIPIAAQERGAAETLTQFKVIHVPNTDGQILSYRNLTGSTEVRMRGTNLAPDARIKLKVGSRPGFVEIDINRGDISGLRPAHRLGKDFLTYVFWVVSVDGKASNLGEITFQGESPVSINVTTPYQTFWLMLTAEPDFAVVDPSPRVILYSTNQSAAGERAQPIQGDLIFFTHYTAYDSAPGTLEPGPNELLQARKAVELASKSGIPAVDNPSGAPGVAREKDRIHETLKQAKAFLTQAEDAHRKNPQSRDVLQLARTAAQIAENARALALGAVGDTMLRHLQNELATARAELAKRQAELAESARLREELSRLQAELADAQAKLSKGGVTSPPVETKADNPPTGLASKPIVWIGFLGWALALLLLFRRRGI